MLFGSPWSKQKDEPGPTVIGQSTQPAVAIVPAEAPTPPVTTPPAAAAPAAPAPAPPQVAPSPRNVGDILRQAATGESHKEAAKDWLSSYAGSPNTGTSGVRAGGATGGADAAGSREADATTVAFKGAAIPGGKSGRALDLTYTLMPQLVHCQLDGDIDTTQPGPFFCHTREAVKSPKDVVLMEAQTLVVANYKPLQQGQNRVFAMAGYAITPFGVPVPLDAPMEDGLGRAGVPGVVNSHTMERFGGTLLLMGAQTVMGAAQALAQRGNSNSYVNLNTGSAEGIISQVLQNTINIPPTLTAARGTDVTFAITHPIDFSASYSLKVN